MSKLGVGVGDAFPVAEVQRDEGVAVHRHDPRRRGRWLRLILWCMLVWALLRALDILANPRPWDGWGAAAGSPYAALAGLAILILVIGVALWLLRCRRDNLGAR